MRINEATEDYLKPKPVSEITTIAKGLIECGLWDVVLSQVFKLNIGKEVDNIAKEALKNNVVSQAFLHKLLDDIPSKETTIFKEMLKKLDSSEKINEVFSRSARKGFLDTVKYLLEEKNADIHNERDYALRWASYYNHIDVVKYLLENDANKDAFKEKELVKLAKRQNFEILTLLGYDES